MQQDSPKNKVTEKHGQCLMRQCLFQNGTRNFFDGKIKFLIDYTSFTLVSIYNINI